MTLKTYQTSHTIWFLCRYPSPQNQLPIVVEHHHVNYGFTIPRLNGCFNLPAVVNKIFLTILTNLFKTPQWNPQLDMCISYDPMPFLCHMLDTGNKITWLYANQFACFSIKPQLEIMLYIVAPYSMNVKTAMSELLAYIHHYICKENSPTPMISMTNKFEKDT